MFGVHAWPPRSQLSPSRCCLGPTPGLQELRRRPGGKMLFLHCVFPRLSSRPTVSPRRDDSRCHQVPIFIDQSRQNARGLTLQGPFIPNTARTLHRKLCLGNLEPQHSRNRLFKKLPYRFNCVADTNIALLTRRLALPNPCLLYTSPSPRDGLLSRMPSSA